MSKIPWSRGDRYPNFEGDNRNTNRKADRFRDGNTWTWNAESAVKESRWRRGSEEHWGPVAKLRTPRTATTSSRPALPHRDGKPRFHAVIVGSMFFRMSWQRCDRGHRDMRYHGESDGRCWVFWGEAQGRRDVFEWRQVWLAVCKWRQVYLDGGVSRSTYIWKKKPTIFCTSAVWISIRPILTKFFSAGRDAFENLPKLIRFEPSKFLDFFFFKKHKNRKKGLVSFTYGHYIPVFFLLLRAAIHYVLLQSKS